MNGAQPQDAAAPRPMPPAAAMQRIATDLPRLLQDVSIQRSHIIADQWMTTLRSGRSDQIVAAAVKESESTDQASWATAVAIAADNSDVANVLFAAEQIVDAGDAEIPAQRVHRLRRHLVTQMDRLLRRRSIAFAQWATDAVDAEARPRCRPVQMGFTPLGTLQYMALQPLRITIPEDPEITRRIGRHVVPAPIEQPVDDDFRRVVEATYTDSLDCPGFSNFRSAAQLLESYRRSDSFCDSGWHLITKSDATVGVLLMSLHASKDDKPPAAEVTYMGVLPEFRGGGLGAQILEQAVTWALDHQCDRLLLAVDTENQPAGRIYRQRGFRPILLESIWGRKIENR
ncbi:GNAT family N-acetyltransferase [Crateriforma conspicua]|uniref:TDP-fucosamine acetyltransferase n=1 Tax=Crateriforma conspicua TaxID=2527996 RepID=A0A5C6FXI8_9PLAN|nr:GNAT family N-acetyltransferase [Crateriforma conspicua]TWU67054.1 TDP-fucosamine acetyltransferase [Crateriforma conspicua]